MDKSHTAPPQADILVVDDTPAILRLLSQMLTGKGYQVRTAASGAEALEAVREHPPDLILLDIMMPEMSGYELCQRLKDSPSTRDTPVLFISALDDTEDKLTAFTAGGVDYVTKPFQMEEVLARVATHLSLRAMQQELQAAGQKLAHQVEELQARNEELDAFAHAVAHDLKKPLTSIIGFADMLEEMHGTLPGEEVEESLQAIAANGRRMDRIIDELLLLAGVRKAERVEVHPLDMGDIVAAALRRLRGEIEQRQAEVSVPERWPVALGHGPWVEEVWVNYVRSAIEHGGPAPRVALGATPEGEETVRFWARNEGPGSAAGEERDRPAARGGLGLTIVRRIMEKLGRQASVESIGDGGRIFSFTLRAHRPPAEGPTEA